MDWIFRLKLDRPFQVLFCQREIVSLHHFKEAREFMRAGEVRHQRERFLKVGADFRGDRIIETFVAAFRIGGEPVLLFGVEMPGQKIGRAVLKSDSEQAQRFVVLAAFLCEQSKPLVRQRAVRRKFLGVLEINFRIVGTVNAEEFIT